MPVGWSKARPSGESVGVDVHPTPLGGNCALTYCMGKIVMARINAEVTNVVAVVMNVRVWFIMQL